jgi:hypothetical protein
MKYTKTTPFDIGNPGPDLEKAQNVAGLNRFNGITIFLS